MRDDISESGKNVKSMPVYRLHLTLRMPTPFAEEQFPIGAKLRQDEDGTKQARRKEGRTVNAVEEVAKAFGSQATLKVRKERKEEPDGRKLAKAVIVQETDLVTLMNLSAMLGDNYTLIGYDFSVTDTGRSTKIKLRLVREGMKFDRPKPAEDEAGRQRQEYFHSHQRELWTEFVRWAKRMCVSIRVSKNEARVMPDHAIIQVDATHARQIGVKAVPGKQLVINANNAFLANI